MKKPHILLLLQNFYYYGSSRKLHVPVYDTRIINRKNATYSRIVPYLEPHFELYFGECTASIANNHKTKFATDLCWVKSALDWCEWEHIIAFGAQAHKACDDLNRSVIKLPHPISFKWRKALIQETVASLT
jgi:hypothetical protein